MSGAKKHPSNTGDIRFFTQERMDFSDARGSSSGGAPKFQAGKPAQNSGQAQPPVLLTKPIAAATTESQTLPPEESIKAHPCAVVSCSPWPGGSTMEFLNHKDGLIPVRPCAAHRLEKPPAASSYPTCQQESMPPRSVSFAFSNHLQQTLAQLSTPLL